MFHIDIYGNSNWLSRNFSISNCIILLMEKILHQLIGTRSLSHYLQGFYTSQVVQDFFHQQHVSFVLFWVGSYQLLVEESYPFFSRVKKHEFIHFFSAIYRGLYAITSLQGKRLVHKTREKKFSKLHRTRCNVPHLGLATRIPRCRTFWRNANRAVKTGVVSGSR